MKLLHIIIQLVWVAVIIMIAKSFSGAPAFLWTYIVGACATGFLFQKFIRNIDWDEVLTVISFSGAALLVYLFYGERLKFLIQNALDASFWIKPVLIVSYLFFLLFLLPRLSKWIPLKFSSRNEDKRIMEESRRVEKQEKALWDGLETKDQK